MFKNGFFGPMNAKTQEGMGMSDLPKNIQVIFDNNPMLKELIPESSFGLRIIFYRCF